MAKCKDVAQSQISQHQADIIFQVAGGCGVDARIIEQRDAGKAVLLISAELDEIRSLSDRIAVMYEGKIVDIISPDAIEEQVGILMTGGHL